MEETISLQEIFSVIKKRILLIISLVVGAAVIAAIVSYFILTPTYQSTSQFLVNQGEQDADSQEYNINDIRTNVELINTYNVIIKSPAILADVVDDLDLPYTEGTLENKIEVSNEEDSQVVTVTATDSDAGMATDLANNVVEVFKGKLPDLMNGVDNVSVLSEAKTADDPSPVSPKPLLNIAIAVVLGGMVGVGLAFLLEYLDTTIKTEEDISNHLNLPVLGVVTHVSENEMRGSAGKSNQSERGARHGSQKRTK